MKYICPKKEEEGLVVFVIIRKRSGAFKKYNSCFYSTRKQPYRDYTMLL